MAATSCNVYVGSETGLFKGVNTEKKAFQNFNPLSEFSKENEITSLCWADAAENEIYIGQKNKTVKLFDCNSNAFVKTTDYNASEGNLIDIANYNGRLLTATDDGIVRLWNEEDSSAMVQIDAGEKLCRMRQNASNPHEIATGGEENDLKIWDVKNPENPVFRAKNVRNDFLDLRVPVWVTDMQFLPESSKIATCTRHHQIRLYDPNSSQRRPVISMEFETYPLISLSLAHQEWQLVVGSSRGRMALIDLRRKALVHVFKGFAGSIRCVQCHPNLPLVASCGLDRFLRVHDLNTHKLLTKLYLKSKLNTLLMRTLPVTEQIDEKESLQEPNSEAVSKEVADKDDIWDQMKVIKSKKRPLLNDQHVVPSTKKKKSKVKQ